MADRDLFQGFTLQAVDAKGRVSIPADLRTVLEHNNGGPENRLALIGRDSALGCLVGYDTAWARERNERLNALTRIAEEEGRAIDLAARRRDNRVERVAYDPSGRIVLPAYERDKAGIANWAFFAGDGDQFQIWAPARLLADTAGDEDLQDRCRYAMKLKGVAL
ncbi:division/cell wall cluster transcriptional repressor MraZ [Sphingomonas baiyangensis]|uniref:division/cell wall cluster transcriptional repressor MraZ n=1 Tax=Sphingomonas baiyangensis TaxID=2572576 RepID=UPI00146ED2F8|nr:division/cell wall cluster transcriptional repressor MraZ [Sphingomonas baiyangensis]